MLNQTLLAHNLSKISLDEATSTFDMASRSGIVTHLEVELFFGLCVLNSDFDLYVMKILKIIYKFSNMCF